MNFIKDYRMLSAETGMPSLLIKTLSVSTLLLIVHFTAFSQSITTSPITGTYCDGATVGVPFTVSGSFVAGNVFTAQLSDASGAFGSPVAIGTLTATAAGTISATLPQTAAAGTGYRIRVVASNPIIVGTDNSFNLTINIPTLAAPTFTNTSFCQGDVFNITVSTTCNFFNSPTNTFTAELSDAAGSFASPVSIGTRISTAGGVLSATIPAGTPAGSGYRIRLKSIHPALVSNDNGSDLVVSSPAGTPSIFGNGVWNVYCYTGNTFNSYAGYYTENNLTFNTTTRWDQATTPSNANANSGLAYQGCPIAIDLHSYSYKRTNFTCGYYQIDIPTHDDDVTLFINGSQVFVHNGCCDAHTNVWTGFLGPTSTVEVKEQEGGGSSYLSVNFSAATNPMVLSNPATVCSGKPTTLTASAPIALTYQWMPGAQNGPSVTTNPNPTSTTTYTATGTDATTSCTLSKTVLITVSPTPSTGVTASLSTICSGIATSTLTASGANTYTWSPAAGLSATTGSTVTANPTTTTTYTVVGDNGCSTNNATKQIVVETIPSAPSPSAFGNGAWNIFVYSDNAFGNFYGYYSQTSLNINTIAQWNTGNPPSSATATGGTAYSGCTVANTNYSLSFKRTNIPCGYYQIDIPYHDDNVTLLINGTQVFQHVGCCDTHTNAWGGFLQPSSTVEFRLVNFTGPGGLQANITSTSPLTLSAPVTICAGTSTTLTATSSIVGATYSWTPTTGLIPPTNTNSVTASPGVTTTYTNTITDAGNTNCTAFSTVLVTVDPLPNTSVAPTSATITCPTSSVSLTASGANTYTWTPAAGLSATTGNVVSANPTVTTTYTVSGSNNCSSKDATTTITVIPLPSTSIFPTNTWNAYCFSTTTLSGYQGYYTENGSGASTYDFNTTTRWASGSAPSTANNTNGNAYVGCTMPASNISLSFKRTNFACGMYQVNILNHDDDFKLIINGVQVGQHVGAGDAHTAIWTGSLNSASQVELQLVQGTGGSILSVQFVPITIPASQSVWIGGVSNDWSAAGNWCGSGVPNSATDVIIPAAGPQNMPTISTINAACKNITIKAAVASGTYNSAIVAATLTVNGSFNLDVNGNWSNLGTFNPGTGTVTFKGAAATIIDSPTAIESFYNVVINNSNGISIPSGIHQIINNITFTSGVLNQNGTLVLLDGAATTGASNASYVNGDVRKVGNTVGGSVFTIFTFPVGAAGFYRPISISAPALATDHFTARYFKTSPLPTYPNSQRDLTMDHMSAIEYWTLNRTSGSSNVVVTMYWDTNSKVGYLADLRVARWDATLLKWKDQGNGGTTGNTTAGTLQSAGAVTSFSPFTFGTTSLANPLPIELVDFVCKPGKAFVDLSWTTSSELNNNYFTVERASDNIDFREIGTVKAVGNSKVNQTYSLRDSSYINGSSYYRLKQTDFDGTTTTLKICSIDNVPEGGDIVVYPNPATNTVYIKLNGNVPLYINTISIIGEVRPQPVKIENDNAVLNVSSLSQGIYIIQVVTAAKVMQTKLAIEK